MRSFLLLSIGILCAFSAGAQCDTAGIYGNDTTNAVCFDTVNHVLKCYANNWPDHSDNHNNAAFFTQITSDIEYYMCLHPQPSTTGATPLYEETETMAGCTYTYSFGVATNGIGFDVNSGVEFVDTSGANNIDWHLEAAIALNVGDNGGHLNPKGSYHYHKAPQLYFRDSLGIDSTAHSPIVGWAADGFPVYFKYAYTDACDTTSGISSFNSGWRLKPGNRPGDSLTAPGGAYDGTYVEDFGYDSTITNLDSCNCRFGVTPDFPNGTYYYVLTDSFPWIPRCFKGTVLDNSFRVGPSASCLPSNADSDCSTTSTVYGCTDPFACNYDASATADNGKCLYSGTDTVSVSITLDNDTVCMGDQLLFHASVTNGGSGPSYQWQINGINVGPSIDSFSPPMYMNGDMVRCIVNSSLSCTFNDPDTSNVLTISVGSSTSSSISTSACGSYTSPSGNYTWTSSGMYNDTIVNFAGCDSFITINLTITANTTNSVSVTACDSYTSPSGNFIFTSSTVFNDTLPGFGGCDSVLTINLTINNSSSSSFSATACGSYTVPSGNQTVTSSAVVMDTIPNAAGCDSVMTISVIINNNSSSSIAPSVCNSYTVPSGIATYTSSGMYSDTIPNAAGCDSIITINLTVNTNTSGSITTATCGSYTSPSGNYTYTMSGVYMDTIANSAGCDSFITINLTVTGNSSSTVTVSACDNYTSPSGNYSFTSSTSFMDTISNFAGCDSFMTINLNILNSSSSSFSASACGSYTSPSGNHTVTSSGIVMDTIPNSAGCDSVMTINVTITNNSSSAIAPSVCNNYTVPSGNHTYSSSGIYSDTIPNAAGCDSIITINLTINTNSTGSITTATCGSYTSPSGNYTYTMSGVYMDTIPNTAGCDSFITINLTATGNSSSTIAVSACNSYTSPSGNFSFTSSTSFMDTIANFGGCDSFMTINLTILNSSSSSFSASACGSYTSPSGNHTVTSSGMITDTIPNTDGCDSVMTINVTITNNSSSAIAPSVCNSYTVPSGNATFSSSGVYTDTLPNSAGCDSIITINLTVNTSTSSSITIASCGSYSWQGNTYTMSGVYMDTISNSAGCDSFMTLNLTIGTGNSSSSFSVNACGSYTVPSGDETYTMSGVYHDTIPNAGGCDSVMTITVTITGSNSSSSFAVNTCGSYTVPSGNAIYSSSGVVMDTIPNHEGCDSVMTINLTINNNSSETFTASGCNSYTWQGNTYSMSGIYMDTIPNAAGCDSFMTLNLTINNVSFNSFSVNACGSYTVPSGNQTITNSAAVMDTIPGSGGCDSILTINVTIGANSSASISPSECGSYTSPGGKTFSVSGTYNDTIPNASGCDSFITINLTVTALNTTVTQNNNILTASADGVGYQWIDCNTNLPLPNANNKSLNVMFSGSYAVVISSGGCADTSNCNTVNIIGISNPDFVQHLNVFPNPTTSALNIDLGEMFSGVDIQLLDLSGKVIFINHYDAIDHTSIKVDGASGIYFLKVSTAEGRHAVIKVLKE